MVLVRLSRKGSIRISRRTVGESDRAPHHLVAAETRAGSQWPGESRKLYRVPRGNYPGPS